MHDNNHGFKVLIFDLQAEITHKCSSSVASRLQSKRYHTYIYNKKKNPHNMPQFHIIKIPGKKEKKPHNIVTSHLRLHHLNTGCFPLNYIVVMKLASHNSYHTLLFGKMKLLSSPISPIQSQVLFVYPCSIFFPPYLSMYLPEFLPAEISSSFSQH